MAFPGRKQRSSELTTNGHPNPRPGDLTHAVRPVKRTLYVEEETEVGREVWEATDQDLLDECLRRGLLTDEQCREMLSGSDTDSGTEHEIPVNGFDGQLGTAHEEGKREVVGTTPAGGEVTVGCPGCGATGAIVDHECQPLEAKLPSEHLFAWFVERVSWLLPRKEVQQCLHDAEAMARMEWEECDSYSKAVARRLAKGIT